MRRIIGSLRRWGLGAIALAACCTGGAFVSGLFRPTAQAVPEVEETETELPAPPSALSPDAASDIDAAAREPARFDRLLLDGRFAEALEAGERLREKTEGPARDALEYRLSLSLETLGRADEAIEGYAALVARCPDTPAGIAAAAGEARVWLRQGKAAKARRQLATLQLRTGRSPLRGHPATGDITPLLALAMVREIVGDETPGPINFAPAHPTCEASIPPLLAAVKWDVPAMPGESAAVPATVEKPGTQIESWTVSACAKQAVAADFLNEVAQKAGLRIEWSADARKAATARTLAIDADRLQFLEVVGAVAAASDLGWELADGKLAISVMPPGPGPVRHAIARRTLLDAISGYPEHILAPVMAVEIGNVEMAAGRLKEAAGWYERLLRERSRSSIATLAYFDLGLARARMRERGLARDVFYQAVDRQPTGPLAPLAYLHIGRLYLEDANPTLAARALRRAQTLETNAITRNCASLLLACAELLDDNPRAAHLVIADSRRTIGEEPFVRPAALLDALSRFRAAVDDEQRERASGDLLVALLGYQDDSLLGSIGRMLVGQAYRDLALGDEMSAHYTKAIPGVGATLSLAMKADLAEHLLASGKKGAAALLREVAATPGPRAARAEIRLAEMALRRKQPDECLSRCRKALSSGDATVGGDAVRLMGQAYTQKGDHQSAARCFSGKPPAPETTEAASSR